MAIKKEITKKAEVVKPAEPAEVAKPEAPKELPVNKTKPVVTVVMAGYFGPLWHPDQQRWVPTVGDCPDGVEMVLDNWLKSQIKAGLVKEL